MFNLLLVDDDPEILELLALALRADGVRIALARTPEQAAEVIRRGTVNAAVLDVQLTQAQRFEGLTLLEELRATHPSASAIVITGCGEPSLLARAYRLGATYFMRKPLDVRELQFQLQLLGMPPERNQTLRGRPAFAIRSVWRFSTAV